MSGLDPINVYGFGRGKGFFRRKPTPPYRKTVKPSAPPPGPKPSPVAAVPFPGYQTPAQIAAAAQAAVQNSLAPQRLAIEQQAAQAAAQSSAYQRDIQGFTAALANVLAGLGPATQQAYNAASALQQGWGSSYSHGLASALGATNQTANAAISAAGGPPGQMVNPAVADAAAAVLAGAGGNLPAGMLSQKGTALATAANLLPATARGQGSQLLEQTALKALIEQQTYAKQLSDLAAQTPGLSLSEQNALLDQQRQLANDFYQRQRDAFSVQNTLDQQAYQRQQDTIRLRQGIADNLTKATGYLYFVDRTGRVKRATDRKGKPVQLAGQAQAPKIYPTKDGLFEWDPNTGTLTQLTKTSASPSGRVVGSDKTGRYWYDPATGKKTLLTPTVKSPTKPTSAHLQHVVVNGKPGSYDPATGFYYDANHNRVVPTSIDKTSGTVTAKRWTAAAAGAWRKQAASLATQAFNGYWTREQGGAPLTNKEVSGIVSAAKTERYRKAYAVAYQDAVDSGKTTAQAAAAARTAGTRAAAEITGPGQAGLGKWSFHDDYQAALRWMMDRYGIPLDFAREAMNRYWRVPGQAGRPPRTSTTPIPASARAIDTFLHQHGSPLASLGSVFVDAGHRYGVDPRLLVAIAGAETSFATDPNAGSDITSRHNAWGYGPHVMFGSWQTAIYRIAKHLKQNYLDQGLTTPEKIAEKWAPRSDGNNPAAWAARVRQFMAAIPFDQPASAAAARSNPYDATGHYVSDQGYNGIDSSLANLANQYGLTLQSGYRSVAQQAELYKHRSAPGSVAAPGSSLHNAHRAIDVAPDAAAMRLIEYAKTHPWQFQELFYDPLGWSIKNGKIVNWTIGGHTNHVHIGIWASGASA